MKKKATMKRLLYLSGALRVSTRTIAESAGPRAHVLGIIKGFRAVGWDVSSYVVGDFLPAAFISRGSESMASRSKYTALGVDVIRILSSMYHSERAWLQFRGKVHWVYERFGLFQRLGHHFKQHHIPWVLETNALLSEETQKERGSVFLYKEALKTEKAAYQECDVLVSVTEALKANIVAKMKISERKIIVVPNGVDVESFNPEVVKVVKDRQFTIGYVGSLVAWQGIDFLIEAVAQLSKNEGIRINVVIAGCGPEELSLRALAVAKGVKDQVFFLGRVAPDEIPNVITRFDVGYAGHHRSRQDDVYFSPLKIYEYMAMGKPILCSRVSGTDFLIGEKYVFLFQPSELKSLVNKIKEIYAAKNLLEGRGKSAREDAVRRHSWEQRAKTIEEKVSNLLDENRG